MSQKIKDLPTFEKPREKAKLLGFKNLSDAELLAILLRTGSKNENVLELAMKILKKMQDLNGLENSRLSTLADIKGVGQVKATTIMAAIELGKRLNKPSAKTDIKILETKDVYNNYRFYLERETQEKFLVLFLNNKNIVLKHRIMFVGSSNQSIIDPKAVFKEAMLENANKIIVMHNHPSGNPLPSKEDIALTKKIKEAGLMLDIILLDHVIVGDGTYFSFYESLKEGEKSA